MVDEKSSYGRGMKREEKAAERVGWTLKLFSGASAEQAEQTVDLRCRLLISLLRWNLPVGRDQLSPALPCPPLPCPAVPITG